MNRATLLDKGIHIPNLNQFMWIWTKQNYNKHVETMENQKDINEEEEWVSKVELATLFLMNWEALMLDIMLEFVNTFIMKGINICFGYQDKVYVISKQLIVDVSIICVKGYIKDPKGQFNDSLALLALESYKIATTNFAID